LRPTEASDAADNVLKVLGASKLEHCHWQKMMANVKNIQFGKYLKQSAHQLTQL